MSGRMFSERSQNVRRMFSECSQNVLKQSNASELSYGVMNHSGGLLAVFCPPFEYNGFYRLEPPTYFRRKGKSGGFLPTQPSDITQVKTPQKRTFGDLFYSISQNTPNSKRGGFLLTQPSDITQVKTPLKRTFGYYSILCGTIGGISPHWNIMELYRPVWFSPCEWFFKPNFNPSVCRIVWIVRLYLVSKNRRREIGNSILFILFILFIYLFI